MRTLTGGQSVVEAPGATLGEVLDALETAHPGVRRRLVDEGGDRIRGAFALYIDGVSASRFLTTRIGEASEIHFMPAISGG